MTVKSYIRINRTRCRSQFFRTRDFGLFTLTRLRISTRKTEERRILHTDEMNQ